jgi:VanZ family protein
VDVKTRVKKSLICATAVYAALLTVGSLLPSGTGPLKGWDSSLTPDVQDALHLPAYGVLVILATAAWRTRSRSGAAPGIAIALACVGFGALMELAQSVIPGRTCSLGDGLVNALGVALGSLLIVVWRRLRPTPRTGSADGALNEERARCKSH